MCARLDMHFAADFTTCVGLISKAECRELRIVVIHHIPTHGALGCDGAARGTRRRDRPFRHSYTNVDTPSIIYSPEGQKHIIELYHSRDPHVSIIICHVLAYRG